MILATLTSSIFFVKIYLYTKFGGPVLFWFVRGKPLKLKEKLEPTVLIYVPSMSCIMMDSSAGFEGRPLSPGCPGRFVSGLWFFSSQSLWNSLALGMKGVT